MNEIRYRLPSADEEAVNRGGVAGGRGGGAGRDRIRGSGGGTNSEKRDNVDYQNLNWILETRECIEKTEGEEVAHEVGKMGEGDNY